MASRDRRPKPGTIELIDEALVVWTSAQARWAEAALGLRHGDKEKPSAIEVRVCAVDARDGREANQGQVPYRVERGVGGTASGSTRPLHRVQERDEALVQQWLKKDYPKIRKMAQKQGAEIYFGDAAQIRSDHHAGCTWGGRGETPLLDGMQLLGNVNPQLEQTTYMTGENPRPRARILATRPSSANWSAWSVYPELSRAGFVRQFPLRRKLFPATLPRISCSSA